MVFPYFNNILLSKFAGYYRKGGKKEQFPLFTLGLGFWTSRLTKIKKTYRIEELKWEGKGEWVKEKHSFIQRYLKDFPVFYFGY